LGKNEETGGVFGKENRVAALTVTR